LAPYILAALLDKPPCLDYMKMVDPCYHKNLEMLLQGIVKPDGLDLTMSVDIQELGATKSIDLVENGANIPVTEQNTKEYVDLLVDYYFRKSIKSHIDAIKQGFYGICPSSIIQRLTVKELQKIIGGDLTIDVDKWEDCTEYEIYTCDSKQVKWFWRAVRQMTETERALLLKFSTGSSGVPCFGEFTFHIHRSSSERLPSAHTCFQQFLLPAYSSFETLVQGIKRATTECDSFGFI